MLRFENIYKIVETVVMNDSAREVVLNSTFNFRRMRKEIGGGKGALIGVKFAGSLAIPVMTIPTC